MLNNRQFLGLHLEGPMQSWGYNCHFEHRDTRNIPTKSGVAGLCAAAYGLERDKADDFLAEFRRLKMTAIVIPKLYKNSKYTIPVSRMHDFHTILGTRRADGTLNNDAVVSDRYYLTDAVFGVILEGDGAFLRNIASYLVDPVWGIWLGRKCCIPTAPVFAGLEDEEKYALECIVGTPVSITNYTREFDDPQGYTVLMDNPVSFKPRRFVNRRVTTIYKSSDD